MDDTRRVSHFTHSCTADPRSPARSRSYLIVPPLFHDRAEDELRCEPRILTIFVVALLVAGYSFTALLCFAVKSMIFQSESIFLPALASSALGLLTVLYNWLAYTHFQWNRASIIAIALSSGMTMIYGIFLIHTNRRITRLRTHLSSRSHNMWQHNSTYYENWIANMFPSVKRVSPYYSTPPDQYNMPPTDDDLVNQQMAMLLMNKDPGPSPDASQSTFRIQLPIGEESDGENSPNARRNRSVRSPPRTLHEYYAATRTRSGSHNQPQPQPQPQPLPLPLPLPQPQSQSQPLPQSSNDGRRGRTDARTGGGEVRAKSREERRQEIELGFR